MIEGVPGETRYLILTLLPLLVPVPTLAVLLRGGVTRREPRTLGDPSSRRAFISRAAVLFNLALVGFSSRAAIAQYPYPEGNCVIPFGLLMVFTPIVSVAVLFRGRKGNGQEQQRTIAHQQ